MVALKPFLSSDGYTVISLPHIGNNAIIASILNGDFEYRDYGLLDRTHIRFFGIKKLQELVESSGYKILVAEFVVNPPELAELAPHWKKFSTSIKSELAKNRYGTVYQVVMKVAPPVSEQDSLHLVDINVPIYVPIPMGSFKSWLRPYLSQKMRFRIHSLVSKFGVKL